jgi:hypothetical protein
MSNEIITDQVKDRRWDEFVENHPFGWICHLSGWKQVLEKSFKHMRGHYLVIEDSPGGAIQAALPLFEVRSMLTGRRLVSVPFATLCDPLVSTSGEMDWLLAAAENLSKKLGSSYIEIRTLSSSPLVRNPKFGCSRFFKHHYLLLDREPETLKKSFHRSCIRQRINRAYKSNLTLREAAGEPDLQDFYRLYLMTRKRLSLPPLPYVFFKSLWELFSPSKRVALLLAVQGGRTIAGVVLFKFKGRVSIEFSALDEKYSDVSPVHYLFWESIKSACQEGFRVLDFGRTSPSNVSLMDFKERWGTEVIDLPLFCYPSHLSKRAGVTETSIGYRVVKKLCGSAPEGAFKLIGRFCYRHLG